MNTKEKFSGFEDLHDLDDSEFVNEHEFDDACQDADDRAALAKEMFGHSHSTNKAAVWEEPCPGCRGTGTFHSYSGRAVGPCFKCKGTGKRTFKTSPAAREAARKEAHEREQRQREAKADANRGGFSDQDLLAALQAKADDGSDFAASLCAGILKYGSLTEKQEAAARKLVAPREPAQAAAVIDLSAVEERFAAAKASGLKRPKLRVVGLVFSPAPAHGKNAGAIYVVSDADQYLGKVVAGEFFKSRECTEEQVAAIVAVAGNVLEAAVAYGKVTGSCSCCGRELTDPQSVALGIGPICREKWGM